MNMETKIHATVRMYLQAYEQRFDNPELLQKWANVQMLYMRKCTKRNII